MPKLNWKIYLSLGVVSILLIVAIFASLKTKSEVGAYINSVTVTGFEDEYGFGAENTPMGEQRTADVHRLVGATFNGTTLDTNFWTEATSTSGTVAVANSQVTLATGVGANSSSTLQSVRSARYVGGSSNRFRTVLRLPDTGTEKNTRKWGIYNATDGAYFKLATTTFSVCTLKTGTPTCVESTSFNGYYGTTFALDTSVHTWEIYWTNSKVYFVYADRILHTVSATATTWADTMNLPVRVENYNDGGSISNVSIYVRVATIARLGPLQTQPISKYTSGQTVGTIAKIGAGNLHGIAVGGVANTSVVTIYDGTSTGGTIIWSSGSMPNGTNPFSIDFQDLPFYNGLFYVISGANANLSIIYE